MGIRATTKQMMQWQALRAGEPRYFVYNHGKRRQIWREDISPQGFDSPQYPPKLENPIRSFGADTLPKPRFSVGSSFDGPGLSGRIPPDSMGDVSPTSVVVMINGWVVSFDRSGNVGALNLDQDTFYNSVRGGAETGDGRVCYDRLSGKWILTAFTVGTNNKIVVAVSDGPTISASTVWTFFSFQHNIVTPAGDNNLFFDYPSLGVDSKALYIGGNLFGSGNDFSGTSAFVVRKSSILGAGPIIVSVFRGVYDWATDAGLLTTQGVSNDDANSTDGYFLGLNGFWVMTLRKVTDPGGTPSASNSRSDLPKLKRPARKVFASALRSTRVEAIATTRNSEPSSSFKNKFLVCAPDNSRSSWLLSATVNTGSCSTVLVSMPRSASRSNSSWRDAGIGRDSS